MRFLATEAGLLAESTIVLIDDSEPDVEQTPVHYQYGHEVRVTTADDADVRALLRGNSPYDTRA